ncbi:hypothetical protein FALBO_8941 [Fusarium albosuccineum]|uniref:Uncharacterized protein n=1 Tax=Fusarium albosuccineum TaxID=1237068 RepID=A0A8H4PCF1_9HYPO|nr:hypothetical protein FALBO_8941 [Fusarium albosuccineum]
MPPIEGPVFFASFQLPEHGVRGVLQPRLPDSAGSAACSRSSVASGRFAKRNDAVTSAPRAGRVCRVSAQAEQKLPNRPPRCTDNPAEPATRGQIEPRAAEKVVLQQARPLVRDHWLIVQTPAGTEEGIKLKD